MFRVGDYAVCPGHGVGKICDIEDRDFGGERKSFYVVEVVSNNMKVMIPIDSSDGIRGLVSQEDVKQVYRLLRNHDVKVDNSTWNRRYREYMAKIKTGSLKEIAEVLRELFLLKGKKGLSFGEKKMLDQCKDLLAEEISLLRGNESELVKDDIDACFK